jgi:Uma2 family endonuclease
VVEILSPGTRVPDKGIKARRYAAAGVRYYWIVDPRTRSLDELRLIEGGYERVGPFGWGASFPPELCPGLEIPIDALWA